MMAIAKALSEHAKKWGCSTPEILPMLLFVQRARQLLLHTSSLISRSGYTAPLIVAREIQYILLQHKKTPHNSTKPNVELLVAELRGSLNHDPIAKKLVGDRLDYVCNCVLNESSVNIQLEASHLLLNRLAQKRYLEQASTEISEIVGAGGKQKERLMQLTDGFIAAVRDAGYPAQTVYHLLNICFLDKAKAIMTAKERLEKFFSNFDLATHKYTVYFGISALVPGIEKAFASIRCDVIEGASPEAMELISTFPLSTKRFFTSRPYDVIARFENIEALDPQSARQHSERQLRLLDDLLRFSVHKRRFVVENQAIIVITEKPQQPVHSNRPKPPILRIPHDSADIETAELANFASIFNSANTGSVERFVRALELHGTALSAPEDESQLLNIWIAFETLFVSRGGGSKIREVAECIEPYVSGPWVSYEFAELFNEIQLSHSKSWEAFLESAPDLKKYFDHVGLAAAISIAKYEPQMTVFLGKLDGDPLLRFKIFRCIGWAQSAGDIADHCDEISAKIKFDLNRIYRTRNQIVHNGRSTSGLGEVVQTAHHYLDIILNMLSALLGKAGGPSSIEQANMEALVQRNVFLVDLREAAKGGIKTDNSNFLSLLFGRSLLE
jgi:hypothetical protein